MFIPILSLMVKTTLTEAQHPINSLLTSQALHSHPFSNPVVPLSSNGVAAAQAAAQFQHIDEVLHHDLHHPPPPPPAVAAPLPTPPVPGLPDPSLPPVPPLPFSHPELLGHELHLHDHPAPLTLHHHETVPSTYGHSTHGIHPIVHGHHPIAHHTIPVKVHHSYHEPLVKVHHDPYEPIVKVHHHHESYHEPHIEVHHESYHEPHIKVHHDSTYLPQVKVHHEPHLASHHEISHIEPHHSLVPHKTHHHTAHHEPHPNLHHDVAVDHLVLPPHHDNPPLLHPPSLAEHAPLGACSPLCSVLDLIVFHPEFTTLVSLIRAAGLVDLFSQPGPITMFAPTNAAFDVISPNTFKALLSDRVALQSVLLRHVTRGALFSSDFPPGPTPLITGAGERVTVTAFPNQVTLTSVLAVSHIIDVDNEASNGVVHVVDSVF